MGLAAADLRALRNLPATGPGRRVLIATVLGLGLLGFMWWSVSTALLDHPRLLLRLHGASGDSLRTLLGTALMPCPIVAGWLGLSLAQRQLFEAPELLLWRTAPIASWRPPFQVLLRASFLTLLWAAALSLPFVATLLHRTAQASPLAWALVPVAIVACTVPVLCTVLTAQILVVRFLSGPVLRFVLAAVAGLASVGFTAWLLVGLFEPATGVTRDVLATPGAPHRLPWTIDVAATLLANAARGVFDHAALRTAGSWLLLPLAVFWFAAKLHPRAVERHLESVRPATRRRARAWPTSVAAVVRKKELAQVLQQPGALLGFLFFALLVFALVRERVGIRGVFPPAQLASPAGHLATMTVEWFIAVLLVVYAHMGRLVLWDGPQWSLWMSAPVRPWSILRGKLQAIAIFLLWPLVLVGAFGSWSLGVSGSTLATFVGIALGGTLTALGVIAAVGTSPLLMRPDEGGHITQGGRSFVAALVLVLVLELAMSPTVLVWPWIAQVDATDEGALRAAFGTAVGVAWLDGLAVAGLGIAIAVRNFRKLTAPR